MADALGCEGHVMSVRRLRGSRTLAVGLAPVLPVVLVAAWYWGTTSAGKSSYPRPPEVVQAGAHLLGDGELLHALGTSLLRVLAGFAVAVVVGTCAGLLMGRIRLVHESLDPLIETVRPIAPIALVPPAILWLGTGSSAAVFIIAYAAFFPVVLNVVAATRGVSANLISAARTLGAGEFTILTRVVLPGIVPGLIVGARLGAGLGWTSVIAAELAIGSGSSSVAGIGQLMLTFYQYNADPNPIVVCMIAVGIVGLAMDLALRQVGRTLTPWREVGT